MKVITAAALGVLLCTVVSASSRVKEERKTAFFGEDIHIDVPAGDVGEVVFKSRTNQLSEVVLLRAGEVVNPRGRLNSLGHLVLEDVQEEDEGVYITKNSNNPNAVKRLILIVRDCAVEKVVKYGETYNIHLNNVDGPIVLEFRPGPMHHTNHSDLTHATEAPAVVLYNQTVLASEYAKRLRVSDKHVTLHSVTMTDEGSFTVLDRDGKVRRRNCLNVREHQDFKQLSYGGNLKMEMYLPYSNVSVVYRPKSDNQDRVVLDQGVLMTPLDPMLEGRLSVEGSQLTLKKVNMADEGVFKVTDLAGFPVAHVYIEVQAYKLPPLTVAVLSMLGLIAFMLLVCLLSCLYKVHKRNEKNKKLMLLAQQAGKGDGEAFRQVVHDAYTRFTEESLTQSVCDKPPESTEVTIKGLEVSKPGRYHALTSDNNLLEMSDSGVEFTISGLPLDSDTDAAVTYASHKLLLSSPMAATTGALRPGSPDATAAPDTLSPGRTPDSATNASPASNRGATSPASRRSAGPEGAAEEAEGGREEGSAPST